MTTRLALILAVALATYLTRIAGFRLGRRELPPTAHQFLTYVPVAAFTALLVPGFTTGSSDLAPRLAGVTLAALVAIRSGKLWTVITTGLAVYWLTRLTLDAAL
jgi:branched-subunit amino acid transport protein